MAKKEFISINFIAELRSMWGQLLTVYFDEQTARRKQSLYATHQANGVVAFLKTTPNGEKTSKVLKKQCIIPNVFQSAAGFASIQRDTMGAACYDGVRFASSANRYFQKHSRSVQTSASLCDQRR